MRVAGTLAIVGIGLLVVPFLYGPVLNMSISNDSPPVLAPPVLGLICLAAALVWRLVAGPNGIRFAMLLGFASLAIFGYAILELYPIYFSSWVWISISVALFILAITVGVAAVMDRWATRNSKADEPHVSSPN
jgi:hypothetical protein